MISAFCVEDESDEAVACVLLSKILGTDVQPDRTPYAVRRQLKTMLYGTDAPDRMLMTQVALPIASSIDVELLASKSTSFAYLVQQAKSSRHP